MEARHTPLLKFIRSTQQFVIPIYQRKYSWGRSECKQLWDDIIRAGQDGFVGGHFVGSIIYVTDNDLQDAPLHVIDGQQRLTAITLLIAALSEAVGAQEPHTGFSKDKLRSRYLIDPHETGDRRQKLVLSEVDCDTLSAVIDERKFPDNHSLRIKDSFVFFKECMDKIDNLRIVCQGLSRILVVQVGLLRKEDKPQLIFESMNSTGIQLSQSDLIRNYVLMDLDPDQQSDIYKQYWQPMEQLFGREVDKHFDRFMRHYLTVQTGNIPRLNDVYTAFKIHAGSKEISEQDIEGLVKDVHQYSQYYCAMALGKECEPELKEAFQDLRELGVDVAYPLLLELYADFNKGELHKDDFLKTVRLIESYVFRRAVCQINPNSLNKTFASFAKALNRSDYLTSVKAHFHWLLSYRRFPNNREFKSEIKKYALYTSPKRSYGLRRLENSNRKEKVGIGEYTIEHIMPQNISDEWKEALGEDCDSIHDRYLHTLGNLTLTGYNSEYGDKSFLEKRDMQGGFKESPLKLNAGLGELEEWNERTIVARAEKLAEEACEVWVGLDIAERDADPYRPNKPSRRSTYSVDNYPQLKKSPTKDLFKAFQREVLNLDPCVNEEFRKQYIAYKAENNFATVVPQAKSLVLFLSMELVDINDPKELCEDVTDRGHHGVGDVRITFDNIEQLAYVIGIVRQSLEQQLGDDDLGQQLGDGDDDDDDV